MGITRSPFMLSHAQGRSDLIIADSRFAPANVFFVLSTHANKGDATNKGQTPDNPFATINYAITQCTASQGDIIVVLPGHVETITGAAGVAMSIAGVQIIGVGEGRNRPRIDFTTAVAASFDVTAAKCAVENITFKMTGVDAITAGINVSAADFTLKNCELELADATNQATLGILTTSAADRMRVLNNIFHGTADAGTTTAIRIVGGDSIVIEGNRFHGAYSSGVGAVQQQSTTSTNLNYTNNYVNNLTASSTKAAVFTSSTTGIIAGNYAQILSGSAPYTGAAMAIIGNFYSATIATDPGLTTSLAAITDVLYDVNGIATFPAAAIPANNVSMAEVLRQVYAALEGTAASQDGVATWPTAAAYGNNVSLAEVIGYIQDGVRKGSGTALATNESLADVLYSTNGIVTFPSAQLPANGKSIAAVLREAYDQGEKAVVKAAATLVNGTTIFTIANGSIQILELFAYCQTANDATASTLQFSSTPTLGSAKAISGASASLANATAGTTVSLNQTALSTAPDIYTGANGGVILGANLGNKIIVHAGTMTIVVGTGSTTGTWTITMRYKPLNRGVTVT